VIRFDSIRFDPIGSIRSIFLANLFDPFNSSRKINDIYMVISIFSYPVRHCIFVSCSRVGGRLERETEKEEERKIEGHEWNGLRDGGQDRTGQDRTEAV
jgi:hypothetical protein